MAKQSDEVLKFIRRELDEGAEYINLIVEVENKYGLSPRDAEEAVTQVEGEMEGRAP